MALPALLRVPLVLVAAGVLLAAPGCATHDSVKARPLKGSRVETLPLAACRHLTVLPFAMREPAATRHPDAGARMAGDVARHLQAHFGATFESVAIGAVRGLEGECAVHGDLRKYVPGNRAVRAIPWVGGLMGKASLQGQVDVRDGASDAVLLSAPFDKRWSWSGIGGVAKGMDDMVAETTAAIANTLARARGWQPPATDAASDR
jgi:hypothetical protein